MIRFRDSLLLATTKIRARRIRTSVTVAISGLLFGLIAIVVVAVQGVFESVDSFSSEGLNDRYVTTITKSGGVPFNIWDNRDNPEVITRVEAAHKSTVEKKQTAAKKYRIEYDAKTEDPSPIEIDSITRKKQLSEQGLSSEIVQKVTDEIAKEKFTPFNIEAYIKPYGSAVLLGSSNVLAPKEGVLEYMKEGKEAQLQLNKQQRLSRQYSENAKHLTLLPQTLAEPFITSKNFDPTKGELPVIIPFSDAESLLGLKPLEKSVSNDQKLARVQEVRGRVTEIQTSFCYRNSASQSLLDRAIVLVEEAASNKGNNEYKKPSLTYAIPDVTTCGAVQIANDARTAAEKRHDADKEAYEREIGVSVGEPYQQKITLRAVGISADPPFGSGMASSVGDIAQGLLSSSLGYGNWNIPQGLLKDIPEQYRPEAVFEDSPETTIGGMIGFESYYVEFGDKQEARQMLGASGYFGAGGAGSEIFAVPFGSGSLVFDELKVQFERILFWVVLVVSGIAAIILSGMIGRTIADGRKETAVFRAIGATRSDISAIYTTYTLLLVTRIVLFALVLGVGVAIVADALLTSDLSIGAQLAFAASDQTKEFHIIGFKSWYLYAIVAIIFLIGVLSMVVPLLRNVRRSPINDMRDDR